MRLSENAKKRMSQMDAASQRATSNHFDQTYRGVRPEPPTEEGAAAPAVLAVVPDAAGDSGGEEAQAPARKAVKRRSARTGKEAQPSVPIPAEPPAAPPAARGGEVGPTEQLPTSARRKYTIDITPELRNALIELLIRDVDAGRKVAQWQHADAAVTHFLPEPTEVVPTLGDTWMEFGIALTHENRKRAEKLKLQLKMTGRSVPFRCYMAEALRRYIEAMAPDLAKDLPR